MTDINRVDVKLQADDLYFPLRSIQIRMDLYRLNYLFWDIFLKLILGNSWAETNTINVSRKNDGIILTIITSYSVAILTP